ncbi:MAG: hypothetical protein LLG20_12795 [Acidobacteriales bacterium]|nr:hypothetical protein [Terriglobales bacterium]
MRVLLVRIALIQILVVHFACTATGVAYTIDTVAGTDFVGDGGPATAAQLGSVESVAADSLGNVYVADAADHRVRKISPSGLITTLAGNGHPGFAGDGGPASNALLASPYGVAVDRQGNIYIAELGYDSLGLNSRVRKISTDGIIRTIAGGGTLVAGVTGDATAAKLGGARNVAVDAGGNVYVSEFYGHRVYKITADGVISVAAGTGAAGDSKDVVTATLGQLRYPKGLAVDSSGALYIADSGNHAVRKVYRGTMSTPIRGGGEGTAAAVLNNPTGVTVDAAGNLYIADNGNSRIRRLKPGAVTTTTVISSDTPLAAGSVAVSSWRDVVVAADGAIYVAGGQYVARYVLNSFIQTIAGDGMYESRANGITPTMNRLYGPYGVAVDAAGGLYIADQGNNRVRKVSNSGLMTTIAGPGDGRTVGDGSRAVAASVFAPAGVAADVYGNIWIAEYQAHRIRRVSRDGIISTAAGTGIAGFQGDQGTQMNSPTGVVADSFGNVYFSDTFNHRVRKLDANGNLSTVAGKGVRGYAGDGGPASLAQLDTPRFLALDPAGNLYIADQGNHAIRKVTNAYPPFITTVAGTGVAGYSGDGDAAVRARLNAPTGVAADADDNLFIADSYNHRIRQVTADGVIRTIAGTGAAGFSGNGGTATAAELHTPTGLALDADGNIYFADNENNHVRRLKPGSGDNAVSDPVTAASVLNGASMKTGPIAPGEIVSIFGDGIGPAKAISAALDASGLLPRSLESVEVRFDGLSAALFYVSKTQVNAQVPYHVAGQATTTIEVLYDGKLAAGTTLAVAGTAPGIFTLGNGTGQALVVNQDGTLNSSLNPAARGSIVVLYATGEGQTSPGGVDGKPAEAPYPAPLASVDVSIGGYPAEILYAGAAPGFAGLMQINARVPSGYAGAGILPVTLSVGGTASQNGITMAVK